MKWHATWCAIRRASWLSTGLATGHIGLAQRLLSGLITGLETSTGLEAGSSVGPTTWLGNGLKERLEPWLRDGLAKRLVTSLAGAQDWGAIESYSASGWVCGRSAVAHLQGTLQDPLTSLQIASCKLSLNPRGNPEPFEVAVERAKREPIDLARHIARRSDDQDRGILKERVAMADEEATPLGWGLRFIVRGDILLDGGRVMTLDELSDAHGLPRLPLLEEMPDELEVDWDEDTAEKRRRSR